VVKAAMQTGKRAICAGPGNPPVYVDDKACLKRAAKAIIDGAAFDNNLLCIGEKEVFALDKIAEKLMAQMEQSGAVRLHNAQLDALGYTDVVHSFTNDVQRFPDGRTAAIGMTQRTIDVNGTPTNYNGMTIVVLDADFRVAWAWNSFHHMDVNRAPVLGEIIQPSTTGPSTAVPLLPSVDWLHINAVSWSPADGNLILSVRHQDWVVKIDYANGAGDAMPRRCTCVQREAASTPSNCQLDRALVNANGR
jgi:hypothetical protein